MFVGRGVQVSVCGGRCLIVCLWGEVFECLWEQGGFECVCVGGGVCGCGGAAAVLYHGEMVCCMFLQILNYLRSHAHPDMLQKVSGVV